jgi:heptosyltransferase-1
LWYTRAVIARGTHVIEQNLSLVEAITQTRMKVPVVQFPRCIEAEQRIAQQLMAAGIGEFAIATPGAGWGAKRWPAERFGQVAKALARDGVRTILNCGPSEEQLANAAESASDGAAMPLKCSITELIALTRRAKIFVGGDTGPLHLAAALRVPVVAIFGPTDPARNGPYPMGNATRSIVLRNPESPTTHARRSAPDEGMLEITVDAVVDAARTLLSDAPTEGAHG